MTALASLDHILSIVQEVVDGDLTEGGALAVLRSRGYNPDREALDDAITLLKAREGLRDGSLSPLDFFDSEPRIGLNAWETATNECAAGLAWALAHLSKPTAQVAP